MFDFNNQIIQKFVKYYIHFKKHYHIKTKCDHLFNKNHQNNINNNFNDDDNNDNNDDDKFKDKKNSDQRNNKFNNKTTLL